MMAVHSHRLGASALVAVAFAVLIPVQVQAVQASPSESCPLPALASIGNPLYTQVGPYDVIEISYTNLCSGSMLGVVFAVVHNTLGQTVEISTGTLLLAQGANGTAFPVVFGLPDGEYTGTLFATSTAGTGLSTSTTVAFTVVVVD